MWRWSCVLRQGLSAAVRYGNGNGGKPAFGSCVLLPKVMVSMLSSTAPPPPPPPASSSPSFASGDPISFAEAKKLMRLVNVEALKMKLGMEGKEVICYSELLDACESMGVARSLDEAAAFARVLDEAGIVLLFRNKVYLHPDKVRCAFPHSILLILFILLPMMMSSNGKLAMILLPPLLLHSTRWAPRFFLFLLSLGRRDFPVLFFFSLLFRFFSTYVWTTDGKELSFTCAIFVLL